MTVFYAYIHNILDDNSWRVLMVFSCREVADEWWRAISTSPVSTYYQRINSQFYTHDPARNVLGFFTDDAFKTISPPFRGKLFLTLMNDRGGRDLPIIPVQDYTDSISGNWFYIRSKSNPAMYWHVGVDGRISVSQTDRTQFQIGGSNLSDGTIMIGSDVITLNVAPQGAVNVDGSGSLVESSVSHAFTFSDLQKGVIWVQSDGSLSYDNTQQRGQQVSWQLV